MLPYVESLPPKIDFLVIDKLSQKSLRHSKSIALGSAHLLVRKDCDERHTTGSPVVFSGVGYVRNQLVTNVNRTVVRYGETVSGSCSMVWRDKNIVSVYSDDFGMEVLYLYQAKGISAVSNNLHLLIESCKDQCLPITPNLDAFFRRLYPFSIGQQPTGLQTEFNEIQILSVGEVVSFTPEGVSHYWQPKKSYSSYGEAVEDGITGMMNAIRSVCNYSDHAIYRLSGGYDSRIVFGGLIKAGVLPQSYCWTFPDLKQDFNVVQMLAAEYKGKFADKFPFESMSKALTVEDAFNQWASGKLGSYNKFIGFGATTRTVFNETTTAVFFGGGGECFRPFYFADDNLKDEKSLSNRLLKLFQGFTPVLAYREQLAESFTKQIMLMPGSDMDEKLRLYYVNLRNRFHFGNGSASAMNRFNVSPAMQTGFVEAYKMIEDKRGAFKNLLSDIFDGLDEKLKKIPFDESTKNFPEVVQGWLRKDYHPVGITSSEPKSTFSTSEKNLLIGKKYGVAKSIIQDSTVFSHMDLGLFFSDAEKQVTNPKRYATFQASVIGTGLLLEQLDQA